MSLRRRLLFADEPQETRVFLLVAAFGLFIGVVYWFLSYEVAGTVLLLAFGAANAIVAARLFVDPSSARVRVAARAEAADPVPAGEDEPSGGTGGIDTPFLDEAGRLPSESLAPFALGLGAATAATGTIFGPAPVLVGLIPLAWGAWTWLVGARDELDAVAGEEALRERNEAASRGRSASSRTEHDRS